MPAARRARPRRAPPGRVDTRRNLLRNTSTGAELLARTAPQVDEVGRRLVAHLEPGEQRDIVALLAKLIDL